MAGLKLRDKGYIVVVEEIQYDNSHCPRDVAGLKLCDKGYIVVVEKIQYDNSHCLRDVAGWKLRDEGHTVVEEKMSDCSRTFPPVLCTGAVET
ncbi:hypothetical protein ACOMHN_064992 [Nucella lapillus]